MVALEISQEEMGLRFVAQTATVNQLVGFEERIDAVRIEGIEARTLDLQRHEIRVLPSGPFPGRPRKAAASPNGSIPASS